MFAGSVDFDIDSPLETKTVVLTVAQTSSGAQRAGVFWLVLGVVVAWLALTYARSRVARNQALLPARILAQRAADLQRKLGTLDPSMSDNAPNTRTSLQGIVDELGEQPLDAGFYIPPKVPTPWAAQVRTAEYQTYLQDRSRRLDKTDVIVGIGFVRIAKLIKLQPAITGSTPFRETMEKMDLLASDSAVDAAQARIAVANLCATLEAAAAGRPVPAPSSPSAAAEPTPVSLLLEINAIAIVSWIVWGTLTVLAGYVVLILQSPGFGGTMDYIRCALWGFGLPVAGQSLQGLTASSINTQMGVTLIRP
jgi:hypothetical protein